MAASRARQWARVGRRAVAGGRGRHGLVPVRHGVPGLALGWYGGVNRAALEHGQQDFGIADVCRRDSEEITVQHDDVGRFPDFQCARLLLAPDGLGACLGKDAQGLLQLDGLFRVQRLAGTLAMRIGAGR
ncbi:hypothetical protein KESI111651_01125 [Kerstersia similis]